MKTSKLIIAGLLLAIALPASVGTAFAQEARLRAARVGGPDVATIEKMGTFYAQVLGLKEIRRETRADDKTFLEIIMNFGATKEAATAATSPKVVLITAAKGTQFPPLVSNMVFEVTDAAATAAKATAAGGTVSRAPVVSATSGSAVGFINDPAGNRIEIIQPKK
jgi:predicted enzyme related to lactoylglutathione lyase